MSYESEDAPRPNRRERRKQARAARIEAKRKHKRTAKRTDDERRDRMRDLDDRTPLKPSVGDLIVASSMEDVERLDRRKYGRK